MSYSSLEAFIAGVEKLRTMNEDVAKAAEKGIADAARESATAAETPAGDPWPELAEGGKALRGAAGAIKASTKGNRVTLTIGEPYVFHNHGAGGHSTTKKAQAARKRTASRQASTGTKSKFHAPRRQILPEAGESIPAPMNEAIEDAAARVFGKAMGR